MPCDAAGSELDGTESVPPLPQSLFTGETNGSTGETRQMPTADRTPHEAAKLLTNLSLRPGIAATLSEGHLALQLAYEQWVAGSEAGIPDLPRGIQRRTRRGELRRRVAEVQFALRVALSTEEREDDPRQLTLPLPVTLLPTAAPANTPHPGLAA